MVPGLPAFDKFSGRARRVFAYGEERVRVVRSADFSRSGESRPPARAGIHGLRGGGSKPCASCESKRDQLFPGTEVGARILPSVFHEKDDGFP